MTELTTGLVTPERWDDLARLFGPSGAYSGCWCMFLRLPTREFDANCPGGGAANKEALRNLVAAGREPGLLAYRGEVPVGWVAVAPRSEYSRVLRSPVHKPTDDEPGIWSITCFYIDKSERGHGVANLLLDAAVAHAADRGAQAVEAYPVVVTKRQPAADVWRGTLGQFERAGFEVLLRRKPARPIVRRRIRRK